MSKEAAIEFLDKVAENEELLEKLEGVTPEQVEALGANYGLSFTADELHAVVGQLDEAGEESDELSEDELDSVAGGRASNTRAASRMRKYGAATVARVQAGLPAWLGPKTGPR